MKSSKTKNQLLSIAKSALVVFWVVAVWIFFAPDTHAASTTSIAGTVASTEVGDCNDTTAGENPTWSTTLSAYQISDNTDGTYGGNTFDSGDFGAELRLSNFHFTESDIPKGSIVDGIEVSMERGGSSGDIKDYKVWLTASSTTAKMGSNHATSTVAWSTVDQTSVFGGSGDLWSVDNTIGAGAATSSFNGYATSTSFGLIFCPASIGANGTASVDHVTITIYYTTSTFTQDGYRFRANHQTETGTTWLAAEDTVLDGQNVSPGVVTASTTRLRILMDETTASAATTTLYQLEYATSTVGSVCSGASTWVPVADQASTSAYAWKMSPTSQFANGGATTNLADPNGLTDATGSFRAGVTQDTTSRLSSGIAHAAGEFTELEWSIEASPREYVTGGSYCFRATNADDTTDFTYTVYPKINLATSSPALQQLHYKWRANHQTETGTTWLAAEDIVVSDIYTASTTRLRMLFDETGGKTGTTTLYQLEYATSTISGYTGCSALSEWVPVPMTASSTSFAWIATSTAQLVNRDPTTNVASGLSDPSDGIFEAGQTLDRNSTTTPPLILLDGNNFTEIEWTLEPRAQAEGDSYCFRVTNADDTTNFTYTVYPRASVATTTFTQSNFRIYKNINNITPTTAWDNLSINVSMSSTTTPDRIGGGDEFRLRLNVTTGTVDLPPAAHQFSLQYTELSSGGCSDIAEGSWKSVGAKSTSIEAFTFVDNLGVADTATISDVTPLSSNVGGLYHEVQNTTTNPNSALEGQTIEYDWALRYPSARYSGATFCFRMAKSDDSALTAYSGYPRVLTNLVGSGSDITIGAPTGGSAKGAATTTGGTLGGGSESGGTPPPGAATTTGGTPGGGGEVWIPFFRYYASILTGTVEFVAKFINWRMGY